MEEQYYDRINEVDLKKTMETSYIDYAMSVIASRALPDVRDGLKPVQRRILFSMVELNNGPDKPHRKCARIVGDTMGKYHPHGDSSIYGSLVNMAQEWSMRYCLVDGHGNFGSVDGDNAAAMRYTEARLSKISMEMLSDINKDTVDFVPNFDETEKEPSVLPARFPNLLVNGTTGIAVGMATNIPPHNLREVIDSVIKIIENRINEDRETDISEILGIVKGPDFPTGGVILGGSGIEEAYRTGRGKITVRAVTNIEYLQNGKPVIIVTELPYLVNKAKLIKYIADLVKDKRIDGITDLRDESNREGLRVVIELRRDCNPNLILNQLYKHTDLQTTFGVIMLALVNNEPHVLNLLDVLKCYLRHQEDVVTRRTKFDLNKAEERAHILEGLLKAIDAIDEVIRLIRSSNTVNEAKEKIIDFLTIDEPQAQAIVEMRLRSLAALEREKLEEEYSELQNKIKEFREILADPKKLLGVIKEEITAIEDKYGDDRRTQISQTVSALKDKDIIKNENVVIAMTSLGYIKRMSVDNFSAQYRGGKGIKGITTIENDYIEDLLMTSTLHYVVFMTNMGKAYRLKAYEIPEGSRTSRGVAIINLIDLLPEEKVTATIPVSSFDEEKDLIMATKNGILKKSKLSDFAHINKSGLKAIALKENDELIEVKTSSPGEDFFLVTKHGMCLRFSESALRVMGRTAMGVHGMKLREGDEIIGMQKNTQGEYLFTVTEFGKGKRTPISEFRVQGRGGIGVRCCGLNDQTGNLIGVKAVNEDHEIMMINDSGIIIQIRISDIPIHGKSASGVKVMNLEEGARIVKIAKVRDNPEEEKDSKIAESIDVSESLKDSEGESKSAETEVSDQLQEQTNGLTEDQIQNNNQDS
ncbi:MAG: DNA gyrase subunit A [Lachnospiraceae bacterium]|nr:DNA gyrase subunit A [Lachnospiraceae bacterium]